MEMKTDKKMGAMVKLLLLIMICLVTMGSQSLARAGGSDWKFGLGTGFFGLNLDGTVGMDLTLIDTAVEVDVDMSASDVLDVMETAFGIGGYATNGTWLIDYTVEYLKLEDGDSFAGTLSRADLKFEAKGFEIMVGYPVLKNSSIIVNLHGGVRYTNHEMVSSIVYGGTTYRKDLDNDWVDGLVGVSARVPLGATVSWDNFVNAGYGGSDGTYRAVTGLTWRFHKNWSSTLFGKYTAVEFENSSKGAADWYLYDVDEFGLGINIIYHF